MESSVFLVFLYYHRGSLEEGFFVVLFCLPRLCDAVSLPDESWFHLLCEEMRIRISAVELWNIVSAGVFALLMVWSILPWNFALVWQGYPFFGSSGMMCSCCCCLAAGFLEYCILLPLE
ncbi:hypothetical protein Dimus_025219 [Dionaea muscipula]